MSNKIKILVYTLIVGLLVVGLFPIAALAADGNLVITASEVTAKRGETVEVVLNVTENTGVASLLINVAETEGFELVKTDVKNGTVMSNITVGKNILWENIEDSDTMSIPKDSTAMGTLVTLTFKIADNAKLGKNEIKVAAIDSFSYDVDTNVCADVTINVSNIVINVEDGASANDDADRGGLKTWQWVAIIVTPIVIALVVGAVFLFKKKR